MPFLLKQLLLPLLRGLLLPLLVLKAVLVILPGGFLPLPCFYQLVLPLLQVILELERPHRKVP